MTQKYNIIIIGGGMIGLSLAALLAKHHFTIAIVESKEPTLDWPKAQMTARVSAIHLSSKKLLQYLNLWQHINPNTYAPLKKMTVWDYAGAQLQFDSAEVNANEMGYIIENRVITKALWEHLKNNTDVDCFEPNTPESLSIENNLAVLTLNNKSQLQADVIVGADGANSWVRQQMPVTLNERPYFHKAITAVIKTEKPHQNCAYQKFLETGPVALLPLAKPNYSALVWSANHEFSDHLMSLSKEDFNQLLTNAQDHKLGKISTCSDRAEFTLTMRHAKEYVSQHCALIGDAAHTIHPLAGQGANLGFMDAACLAQTLIDAKKTGKSLGDKQTLRRYTRWRKADNTLMIATMRGLQNLFGCNQPSVNAVRSIGVNTVNQNTMIKNHLMKTAMGISDDLPNFLNQ